MSEQAKHTPGPWADGGWDNFDPDELAPVRVIQAPTRTILAFVFTEASTWDEADADAECVANARLIAAAPELLEALKAYVANDANQQLDDDEMYANAVAAIAKATGVAP